MNKLFDLRIVIGIFFLIIGFLLMGYAFLSDGSLEENNKINQKLANAKVYKGWIIGGASLLLVGGVVFVLLKIYRPF